MEEKKISDYDDEINLIDIFKIIWRYRIFLLVFVVSVLIISFLIFYFTKKTDDSNTLYSKAYIFNFNFKTFTFELYNNIKMDIKYDLDNKYFEEKYNIQSVKLMIIKDKNIIDENKINSSNFPNNILALRIDFVKEPDDSNRIVKEIDSYIKNIIFKSFILSDLRSLRDNLNNYLSRLKENPSVNDSELALLFTNIIKDIEYILVGSNKDVDKSYDDIKNYLNKISSRSYSLSFAKDVFINIVDNDYKIATDLCKSSYNSYKIKNIQREIIIDLMKKLIIIFIVSVFVGLVLIFIIDFFKKNWKEIVK